MKRLMSIVFLVFAAVPVYAQQPGDTTQTGEQVRQTYMRGEVIDVFNSTSESGFDMQQLTIRIRSGELDGLEVKVDNSIVNPTDEWRRFVVGDTVIVNRTENTQATQYFVLDLYRLPSLLGILLVFFATAMLLARRKGAWSILGLGVSVLVLVGFIVPQIVAGHSPLIIAGIGAVVIALISMYMAHGFNKETTLALGSMLVSIILSLILAVVFVHWASLFGIGSEDAYYLQFSSASGIDLRGLLLAGIIIGTLGVLDDIATSLVATVDQIHQADVTLPMKELYTRGIIVGTEHIASLINTLVLAYAGASLPLLLIFSLDTQPLWVTLNSQFMAEEIVRTLVGSTTLLLAVPITTFMAASYFAKQQKTTHSSL